MLEFTGERVIPGVVDPELFDEHRARYRFAAWFAQRFAQRFGAGAAILDAGCGSGYGASEFKDAGSVTAFDISAEAVQHARDNFAGPHVWHLQAGCESLPFADGSFDLVVAFEVIEHLERWQDMLREARRVLKPAGVLLVSTPNRAYYAESRAAAGPNPFHVREFDHAEFSAALDAVFPHVSLWTQNHVEGLGFLPIPASQSSGVLDAPPEQDAENAYFFLGACSGEPVGCAESFAYLPESGNLLRKREHHIALLSQELEQKTSWLKELEDAQAILNREHKKVVAELEEHNAWAAGLNEQLLQAGRRVLELQEENSAAGRRAQAQIGAMERAAEERLQWVHDLESQIARGTAEIKRLNEENTGLRVTYRDRSEADEAEILRLRGEWKNTTAELEAARAELQAARAELVVANDEVASLDAMIRAIGGSRWYRLGHAIHLGPDIPSDKSGR
ncbi:MAG TPA: methyltransferase domain-containing protein [Bryobacteraceae bacterium]|jgi:SAM-dependent methyltransferase|nr:methyltransferase domain-containing protein [Bryobacteraceae bacterium]